CARWQDVERESRTCCCSMKKWRRWGAISRMKRSVAPALSSFRICPTESLAKSCTSIAAITSWARQAGCCPRLRRRLLGLTRAHEALHGNAKCRGGRGYANSNRRGRASRQVPDRVATRRRSAGGVLGVSRRQGPDGRNTRGCRGARVLGGDRPRREGRRPLPKGGTPIRACGCRVALLCL